MFVIDQAPKNNAAGAPAINLQQKSKSMISTHSRSKKGRDANRIGRFWEVAIQVAIGPLWRRSKRRWPTIGTASLAIFVLTGHSFAQTDNLNVFPEAFERRMHFPVDEQAVIMAERGLTLPETDADLDAGDIAGLQPMLKRQLYLNAPQGRRAQILDTKSRRFDEPVTLLLSKYRYPWEDRHLDVVVWTTSAGYRPGTQHFSLRCCLPERILGAGIRPARDRTALHVARGDTAYEESGSSAAWRFHR